MNAPHPLRRRTDSPSSEPKARNFLAVARTLPPVSNREVDDHSHSALITAFPGPNRRKLAALKADANPKAAKNWFERENGLSLTAFINLCRQEPQFRAEVLPLLGADVTEDIERLLTEAVTRLVRER